MFFVFIEVLYKDELYRQVYRRVLKEDWLNSEESVGISRSV